MRSFHGSNIRSSGRRKAAKSALLIGSTANDVAGMGEDESRALLDELLAWCTQDRFTYRHKWHDGDLVIFNNPGLLHRSYPYADAAGRVMHRTTLKGREAIGASAALPTNALYRRSMMRTSCLLRSEWRAQWFWNAPRSPSSPA